MNYKEIIESIWKNKLFNRTIDIIRIATFIILIIICIYLIANIEAIKVLGLDPCKVCSINKGWICTYVN